MHFYLSYSSPPSTLLIGVRQRSKNWHLSEKTITSELFISETSIEQQWWKFRIPKLALFHTNIYQKHFLIFLCEVLAILIKPVPDPWCLFIQGLHIFQVICSLTVFQPVQTCFQQLTHTKMSLFEIPGNGHWLCMYSPLSSAFNFFPLYHTQIRFLNLLWFMRLWEHLLTVKKEFSSVYSFEINLLTAEIK